MGGGRRLFEEEARASRRRWRPDLDEAAVAAAIETFRRNWPAFAEWWTTAAPGEEIPPEPFESAFRTYLEKAGR